MTVIYFGILYFAWHFLIVLKNIVLIFNFKNMVKTVFSVFLQWIDLHMQLLLNISFSLISSSSKSHFGSSFKFSARCHFVIWAWKITVELLYALYQCAVGQLVAYSIWTADVAVGVDPFKTMCGSNPLKFLSNLFLSSFPSFLFLPISSTN